jgi:hypothetical protein
VNDLAQQASGFRSNQGKFGFLKNPDILVCHTRRSGFWSMCSATIYSVESSAKPKGPKFVGLWMNQAKQ